MNILINTTALEYNNVYYVDPVNGDDLNDGGSSSPYLNFYTAYDLCQDGDAVFLMAGTHILPVREYYYGRETGIYLNKSGVDVIGVPGKTIVTSEKNANFINYASFLMFSGTNSRIYSIIFKFDYNPYAIVADGYGMSVRSNHVYNCVFDIPITSVVFYLNTTDVITFRNCLINTSSTGIYYNSGKYKCENTAFTANAPSNSVVPLVTCLPNVTIDESYKITSYGWEDSGTGFDIDGSIADIGVYGGEFAWEAGFFTNTIFVPVPDYGYVSTWNDIELTYVLSLVEGLAFDDVAVDYDFYTTADKIILRPLSLGTIIGGRYTDTVAFEVINTYNNVNVIVTLYAVDGYNNEAVPLGTHGQFPDSEKDEWQSQVAFSDYADFYDNGFYPAVFPINAGQKKTVYFKFKPGLDVTTGVGQLNIMLTTKES